MKPALTPEALWAKFEAFNAELERRGFHVLSPWWREQLKRFLLSSTRRWVIRAGRRAGKSSALCRLACFWAIFGTWEIPVGDIACIPWISVDRAEAAARLRTIESILEVLSVGYDRRGEEIEITTGRPVLFRVVTCSISGVVGFTSIAVFCDEVALWDVDGANPAGQIFANLVPTLATQPDGFIVLSSSPWGPDDLHAQKYAEGDHAGQTTSFAESWVANPTLTEAGTHADEPDLDAWRRAYAAIPSNGSANAAFDPLHVAAAFGPDPPGYHSGRPFAVLDPSDLKSDAFVAIFCKWLVPTGRRTPKMLEISPGIPYTPERDEWGQIVYEPEPTGPLLRIYNLMAWEEEDFAGLRIEHIVEQVALALPNGSPVFSDQRADVALGALFSQFGVRKWKSYHWSSDSKAEAVRTLRRMFKESSLSIAPHAVLEKQLKQYSYKLTPGGNYQFQGRGKHDDHAAAVLTLAHVLADPELIGTPLEPRSVDGSIQVRRGGRVEVPPPWHR